MSKLHFGKARKVAKNIQERIKPPPKFFFLGTSEQQVK